jgi:hypothetical protein
MEKANRSGQCRFPTIQFCQRQKETVKMAISANNGLSCRRVFEKFERAVSKLYVFLFSTVFEIVDLSKRNKKVRIPLQQRETCSRVRKKRTQQRKRWQKSAVSQSSLKTIQTRHTTETKMIRIEERMPVF